MDEGPPPWALDDELVEALQYLSFAVQHLPDRAVYLDRTTAAPVVVYTDASTDHGPTGLRMGALVFIDHVNPPLAFSWDVPYEFQQQLQVRNKQIMPAELLAIPVTALAVLHLIRHRDVIAFVDNTAALSALVKCTSNREDTAHMTLVASMLFVTNDNRVWHEYVNTLQNPADVLSREAFASPLVSKRIKAGEWRAARYDPPWHLFVQDLSSVAQFVSALGVSDPVM